MISNTVLGIIATCCTTVAFLPQVVKVFRTGNTKSIAMAFILIKMIGSFLWVTYGIMIESNVVMFSCSIVSVCTSVIFCYKLKNVIINKEKI